MLGLSCSMWNLVPSPGIKPQPSALGAQSLCHWTTREVPLLCILATSSYCPLLLLGPYHFCPLLCPSLHEKSSGMSNFLKEISSLSHSIVFLYFFALITEEGFLISLCCSLELCIQMGSSFLFSFAFCFSSFHSYL